MSRIVLMGNANQMKRDTTFYKKNNLRVDLYANYFLNLEILFSYIYIYIIGMFLEIHIQFM
jgi:hypothetical protein